MMSNAWTDASSQLAGWRWTVDAARVQLETQKSPEIPDAVATCTDLSRHVTDLADAFSGIGAACREYADQVDAHHEEIEHELVSFLEWTAGIEIGGAILGGVVLGFAEAIGYALFPGSITYLLIFIAMIVFLIIRPQGIMGKPWG